MNLIQAVVLGAVQGLTEFLPVSSSGHLVIAAKLLGMEPNVAFDVLLHLATLLAVTLFFISDIIGIIKAFIFDRHLKNEHFKLGLLIIIGSIPTAIIGFTLKDIFESMFSSLFAVGCFLILTGVIISVAERFGKARKNVGKVTFIDSLLIGLAQGCAIAPGLSRSGTTVSASLLLGLDRKLAARFSFLLSIPAILGASALKFKEIAGGLSISEFMGFIVAAVSGYFAILIFMKMIEKQKINVFAYYCLGIGILAVIFSRI